MLKKALLAGALGVYSLGALLPFPRTITTSASVYNDEFDQVRILSPLSFGAVSFDDMAYNGTAYNTNGVVTPFIYTASIDRPAYDLSLTVQIPGGSLGYVALSSYSTTDTVPLRFSTHKLGAVSTADTGVTFSSMELTFGDIISTDFLLNFGRVFDIEPYYSYRPDGIVINVHYAVTATVITPSGVKDTYAYVASFLDGETIDLSYMISSFRAFLLKYPNCPCDLSGTSITATAVSGRFCGGFSALVVYPDTADDYTTLRDYYTFKRDFFNYEFPITNTDGLLISAIADDISAFFSIELFPDFSFGTISLIMFGGLILGFTLKMFLGG